VNRQATQRDDTGFSAGGFEVQCLHGRMVSRTATSKQACCTAQRAKLSEEGGEVKLDHRMDLNASLCSLERVVRSGA
jgi:hypothetical protein